MLAAYTVCGGGKLDLGWPQTRRLVSASCRRQERLPYSSGFAYSLPRCTQKRNFTAEKRGQSSGFAYSLPRCGYVAHVSALPDSARARRLGAVPGSHAAYACSSSGCRDNDGSASRDVRSVTEDRRSLEMDAASGYMRPPLMRGLCRARRATSPYRTSRLPTCFVAGNDKRPWRQAPCSTLN